jgi:hypothetical protein
MRFFLFFLFFSLWSGLWWWHYTCHLKVACCPEGVTVAKQIPDEDLTGKTLIFYWADPTPYRGTEFPGLVDSLYSELDNNDTLAITGYYFRDEVHFADDLNLGELRAREIADFFPVLHEQGRIVVSGKAVPLGGDFRNQMFEAIAFEVRQFKEEIPEMEERATLHFPYNSTRRLDETAHSEYLDKLALHLKKTGNKVTLTGHTDDLGTNTSNYYLGLWRAAAVRDYLLEQGVADSQIEVKSMGEIDPVASNATFAGKRKNRRVEIHILKEKQ